MRPLALLVALATVAPACAVLAPDPARDPRNACDKQHDGAACFNAGNLVAGKAGEVNADAVRLYTRGCAARSSASCEALGNVKGPLREQALVEACNGGDLVSCARRASELPDDESGQNEARALRHSACKQSVDLRPGVSARTIEGIAESCAALARMVALGEGGGRDAVAAARLAVLAQTLRLEALYQHEREDDGKVLPRPKAAAPPPSPRRGGILGDGQPADTSAGDRERFRREFEVRHAAREAWMASVDAGLLAQQKNGMRGDPTIPTLTALERAASTFGAPATGGATCQVCMEGCGTMSRCTGDDFVGGHCGQLRTSESAAGAAFDTCVAECAAKVDACAKACGGCNADPAATAPRTEGPALEATSPDGALEAYAADCKARPNDCGPLVAYGQRTLKKKDAARAAQILEKGCELRAQRACAVLAAELEEGERGIPQDVVRAARFHGTACDLGNARSCVLLAVMTEDGRGVRRDARAAARLRTRADAFDRVVPRAPVAAATIASDDAQCRKNQDAQRCQSAAAALVDTDAVKAEELYRLGCTIDTTTCGLWGFAIDRYRRDDPGRATRILGEGCASGAPLACEVLADLAHTGHHAVIRNETHAAELYDKACTLGEPAGCRVIAARYRGVKDAGRADELRARAVTLETEADKPALALQEAWSKDAAQASVREPYVRELERLRAEWRTKTARARARWELRMARLATVEAGNEAPELPPAPPTDGSESATRTGASKRMAKVLFP